MPTQRPRWSLACLALVLIPLSQAGADARVPDPELRRLNSPTPSAPPVPQPTRPEAPSTRSFRVGDFVFPPENIGSRGQNEALENPATGRAVYYGILCGVFLLGILHFAQQVPVPPKAGTSRRAEGLCGTG